MTWRTNAVCMMGAMALAASALLGAPPFDPFVDLNCDQESNFLTDGSTSGPTKVQIWFDAANDGSAGSQQDFGVTGTNTKPMPTLMRMSLLPNGKRMTILNFDRGTTSGSGVNGTSQYLGSKPAATARPTTFGQAFSEGADPAFSDLTGVSWFTVVRTNMDGAGMSQTASRQNVLRSAYSDNGARWGTYMIDEIRPDPDDIVELGSHARGPTTVGGESAGNVVAYRWYITAAVINELEDLAGTPTPTFHCYIIDQAGNVLIDSNRTDSVPDIGPTHVRSRIGRTSNGTSAEYLSGDIAEILIYATALSRDDMLAVVAYLDDKYFVPVCSSVYSDADLDGDTDLADFGVFQACFTGATGTPGALGGQCICLDWDWDGQIAATDLGAFLACAELSGPGVPTDESCHDARPSPP